jgi:hypothetical protein
MNYLIQSYISVISFFLSQFISVNNEEALHTYIGVTIILLFVAFFLTGVGIYMLILGPTWLALLGGVFPVWALHNHGIANATLVEE